MSKELITKAEEIRDEVRVGANTSRRVGGFLEEMAREVNGLYENVLDWINNEKPQGGGFILTQSDVVNNLTDENELKPLSAKQGKLLKAIIDALVVDNLVTNDETKALSAKQGKNLADNIRGLSEVYQPLGDYAPETHTHKATDVQEDTAHKFMTDTEKNTLSSLGTNAALKDFSNVTTKLLNQNGYYKLPDGLLIQWGYTTNSGSNKTIYFPQSFADTNYSIVSNFFIDNANDGTVYCMQIKYKGVSYYRATCIQNTTDNDHGITERPYFYIVIGRWK